MKLTTHHNSESCRKNSRLTSRLIRKMFVCKHHTLILITISLLIFGCTNSPTESYEKLPTVTINHVTTDYVQAEPPGGGLVATKVNILTFTIDVTYSQPKAIEFYGQMVLHGPPENQVQAIYFRTDTLAITPKVPGFAFHKHSTIEPGSTYTLVRPQFPTNEYAPFDGTQGMLKDLKITNAWAIDELGMKTLITVMD